MKTQQIGFIGGGQMAEALIRGLLSSGTYLAENIHVLDPSPVRQAFLKETFGVQIITDCSATFATCDKILLAVKPQVMSTVLESCKHTITDSHLIITIAAGLPISFYVNELKLPKLKVIRVMPNTPALVGQSASALSKSTFVSPQEL